MKGFIAQTVDDSFRLEIGEEGHPISEEVADRIDSLWAQELQRLGDDLYDGLLFSASHVDDSGFIGHFVPYRYFVAQLLDPTLWPYLRVNAVAVTGITRLADDGSILIGQRALTVTQHPGFYELAPSGGIDMTFASHGTIDYRQQLLQELEEETKITASSVKTLTPNVLVYEEERHIWELCLDVIVAPCAKEKTYPFITEYQSLQWVSPKDLHSLVSDDRDDIVPLTRFLLNRKTY